MDGAKPKFARLIFAITIFAPLLSAQSAGSISGSITNLMTGAGIEGVKVRAACLSGGSTRCPDGDAATVTDTAGAFHLAALPDGRYLVSVQKDGFSWSQNGVTPVATVSASGDARFDMKLTPLASLSGRVVATRGYYVSAAILDGRDVLWQTVQLSGPTTVKLVLKKDGGTLRGVVEKGGGSTVVLMVDPTPYARFGLTARCDPDGKFSIPDVPPGNYTAYAFQDRQVLYSSDLLSRIDSARGERVKIEAGGSENVTLKEN